MNRKQRRAKNSADHLSSADDIPMAPPSDAVASRNPKTKTLLEIAAERQAELLKKTGGGKAGASTMPIDVNSLRPENIVQVKVGKDGEIITDSNSAPISLTSTGGGLIEPESAWLDTALLASSLSAVHFTLSVLAMHQYAETVVWTRLVMTTIFVAFPTLVILIATFHGHLFPSSLSRSLGPTTKEWLTMLRSLIYVIAANATGCYLIYVTNDEGYYAVMKDAPSVGTLWVWTVLEMGLLGALLGVAGPAGFAWWYGYGMW